MMQVVCTSCESVNRLAEGRDPGEAKCGRCHKPLFSGHPAEVSGEGLERRREKSQDVAVLVDVWAPWCGPCRAMAPQYEAAAPRLEPEVQLVKLNSDANPEEAGKLGIRGIPTMILFRGGREAARTSGAMSADQIVQWTRNALAKAAA